MTGHRQTASALALGFALVAELASIVLVLGSDSDPAGVRWWLVLAPVVVAALPVVVPRRTFRIGAAVGLVGWSVLAAASIGLFFLPATIAALVAARATERGGVRLKSDTGRSSA